MDITTFEAFLRILAAVLFGAIVGLERELSLHPAGLRTHILVCLGSAVFTIISVSGLTMGLDPNLVPEGVDYRLVRDPGRIAAQVVTGIGFIGGGAVLRHGATVKGLTTAASLWMVASIGMLVGAGYYMLGLLGSLVTLAVLFLLGKLGRHLTVKHQKPYNRLRMLITMKPMNTESIQNWVEKHFEDRVLEVKSTASGSLSTLSYIIDVGASKINLNELSRHINGLTGVVSSGMRMYYHGAED